MIGRSGIAAALLLALAACGEKETTSGTVTGADGEKVSYKVSQKDDGGTMTIKTADGTTEISSGKDERALPEGLSLYPGATVTSSMRMSGTENNKNGTVLSFETQDMPDKVVAYYRAAAEKAGYKIESEVKAGQMQMLGGKNAANKGFSLTVNRDEDKTAVSLIGGES